MALIARPSDLVTDAALVTVSAGTAAAAYPVANLTDRRAHTVTRSTGTTITYQAAFAGARTLQAVALINTNATAAVLGVGGGATHTIPIPATPADGLPLDPWLDLRHVANTSSTFTLALTGPTGVALGEWLLVTALRELKIQWTPNPSDRERHATIVHRTDYGVKLKLGLGVRERGLRGSALGEDVRAEILALERDARGPLRNFLLIPDEDHNDALYVNLATDLREFVYVAPTETVGEYLHAIALDFDEQQKGWL